MTFDWLSDLQPLFAAQASWRAGDYQEDSVFYLTYRAESPFAIACGASLLAEHVRRFRFSPPIIQRLGQVSDAQGRAIFDESFLNFLQRMHLRLHVGMPPEGTLLLPGEPLLIARGPMAQAFLLASAFRLLVWKSTDWATQAALRRWQNQDWKEEDTPPAPYYDFTPEGWQTRARFIGGDALDDIQQNRRPGHEPGENDGLQLQWRATTGGQAQPFVQIRRLFNGTQPLADVWLTQEQDRRASVSKTTCQFRNTDKNAPETCHFERFQNLYQPILLRGRPVLPTTRKGYLRQRTLHQLEAFHRADLEVYPRGWFAPTDETVG